MSESPKDVLLVEDNEINQLVTNQILQREGYVIEIASTGPQALEMLSKQRYRLILMDVQIPEMDGLQITRVIRDRKSPVLDHEVPVVALTAYNSDEDRAACMNAGMDDFIPKPLDLSSFVLTVRSYVGGAAAPKRTVRKRKSERERQTVFDLDELYLRVNGDRDLATHILRGFLKSLDTRVAELMNAKGASDPSGLARAAHTLAGAAGNISAQALRSLLLDLEEAARGGDEERTEKYVATLPEAAARVRRAVEEATQRFSD